MLRKAMGDMSISELSRQSGVPISTISRHVNGHCGPTLRIVQLYEGVLPKMKTLRAKAR